MEETIHKFLDEISNYITQDYSTYYCLPEGYSDQRLASEISNLDFWEPIETAPKDGTWIQGWDSNSNKFLGYVSITGYDFWTDGNDTVFPTHWQPLPNPPKNG